MEIVQVILTALLSVVSLFVITRIMGHKQVAQLDFFDYVSGITIGSIGAEMATELEKPYKPLIALVVYGCVSLLLNLLAHKLPRTRKYINGAPTILLDNGKIYRKNLKKAKLDLSEFLLLCREAGYFDLAEIQTAVFEHNGKLSVLPTAKSRPLTPNDVGVLTSQTQIGVEIIMDGKILGENLHRMGKDEKWLKKRLKSQNVGSATEIFLAVYKNDADALTLYKYE